MRSKYGFTVPYQFITTFNERGYFRNVAFPRLTSFWKRIKVPRGYYAELPPVFTIQGRRIACREFGMMVCRL